LVIPQKLGDVANSKEVEVESCVNLAELKTEREKNGRAEISIGSSHGPDGGSGPETLIGAPIRIPTRH
jgi:hypothetical protein